MARRSQSPFEDFIDIISMFPWWVGASLAPILYFLLHAYSLRELTPSGTPQDVFAVATQGLFTTLAMFGQYVLPFACILGAGISGINKYRRRKLHDQVYGSPAKNALNNMSWRQFEMLVGEAYRRQGYQIKEFGGSGPDGGADLVISKDGRKLLVQCKQWKAYKVGVKPVRELLGVMVGMGAAGGIVVTSGEFTRDAVNFARNNNIQLVDGATLHELIKGVQADDIKPGNIPSAPFCRKCGNVMVIRTAQKGMNAGQKFWGCSGFPTCRYTMPLEN